MVWKSKSGHVPLKALAISLGVLVFLGIGVGSVSAQTGAVEGVVTDAVTSAPIGGAVVMVRGSSGGGHGSDHGGHMVITDENGFYVVDDLEAGEYTVRCGALGYLPTALSVVVTEGQTTVQDIALEPLAFGSVDGVVTDASTGQPVGGALVTLRPIWDAASGSEMHWLSAVTGSDGTYVIDNVMVGQYEVQARAYGYLPNEPVTVNVIEGQTATVDLELDVIAFGSIEGTVTDAVTGAPVGGAYVSIARIRVGETSGDHGGWNGHHTVTDENGFYHFDDVVVASYRLMASAPEYARSEVEVEVLEGQVSVVDVALDPLVFGMVEGHVTDLATGDPVEGALVVILPSWMQGTDGHGGWWMARTDVDGVYRFDEVATGEYLLKTFAHGFIPAEAVAEVFDGQATTVDFALEPHGRGAMRTR